MRSAYRPYMGLRLASSPQGERFCGIGLAPCGTIRAYTTSAVTRTPDSGCRSPTWNFLASPFRLHSDVPTQFHSPFRGAPRDSYSFVLNEKAPRFCRRQVV